MRFLQKSARSYLFELKPEERQLLKQILEGYPVLPPGGLRPRRVPVASREPADKKLLEEALAQHREENARWLATVFKGTLEGQTPDRLLLDGRQIEILLQVLNDIRVGNWVHLGCPDGPKRPRLTAANAAHYWLIELAGHFQIALLAALDPNISSYLPEI